MSENSGRFKSGQHWRPRKPFWEREWLRVEYEDKERSAAEIALDFGVTEGAILHWLHKHGIARRDVSGARAVKKWGMSGEANPMFGKNGDGNPNWKGGVCPLRQQVYSSIQWADAVKAVWDRDLGRCTEPGCETQSRNRRKMHIHHDRDFYQHPESRCDPDYLRLVCSKCHAHIHAALRQAKKEVTDDE